MKIFIWAIISKSLIQFVNAVILYKYLLFLEDEALSIEHVTGFTC